MKVGALEIYWHPGGNSIHEVISATMKTHPAFSALIAKMARAEVKNYLAELAELCEMPFTSPEGLIQALRTTAFIQLRNLESQVDQPPEILP